MKKSGICFLIYDFSSTGGAERASAKLMNELSQNHNITVISVINKYQNISYQIDEKIKVYKLFDRKEHILKNIGYIVRNVRSILKKHRIDYLLSIDVATALMGVLGTRFTKTKLIVCDRSSCFNEDMYSMKNLKVYAWLGIHFSDMYQVMTREGKGGCLEKYHVAPEKIVVIPNWLDSGALRQEKYCFGNKKIITVGRATPEKNYEELIRIAKRVKIGLPGWEWHIWGDFDNDYGKKLLHMIHEEGLSDFLIHKGTTRDIYREYCKYSLFVMTSRFEGMPNVILEAQGSKLPVLAYDCKTGPSELIEDCVNGFLICLNDTDRMCEKVLDICHNERLAERLSAHSWDNLANFSKENVLDKWEKILNETGRRQINVW